MAGNQTTQQFNVVMHTSLPSEVLGHSVPDALNSTGSTVWDTALNAAINVEQFLGQINATSVKVSGSKWMTDGTQCDLTYIITVVSDPTLALELANAIKNAWGLFLVGLGVAIAAWAALPGLVFDLVGAIVAVFGVLVLYSVDVTPVAASIGSSILMIGIPVVLVGGAILYLSRSPEAHQAYGAVSRAYGTAANFVSGLMV